MGPPGARVLPNPTTRNDVVDWFRSGIRPYTPRRLRTPVRAVSVVVALIVALASGRASAVADGTPLQSVATQTVFGAAVGVGNTLMEHDGIANFAMRDGGSQATIPLSR